MNYHDIITIDSILNAKDISKSEANKIQIKYVFLSQEEASQLEKYKIRQYYKCYGEITRTIIESYFKEIDKKGSRHFCTLL